MRSNVARHGVPFTCVPYKYNTGFILFVVDNDSPSLTASESVFIMVAWMILLNASLSVRGIIFPPSGPSPRGTSLVGPCSSSPPASSQIGNELGYLMLE